MTRTWPVDGRFTAAQRRVYEAVLDTNEQCIQLCRDPEMSLRSLHVESARILTEHLTDMGLLSPLLSPGDGNGPEDGDGNGGRTLMSFYPHSIGHWLGLDTHDCRRACGDQAFEEGMVLTVEPGLYIPDHLDIPEEFRGIAVRIEDDVVIRGKTWVERGGGGGGEGQSGTENGIEVITRHIPKRVDEVEAALQQRKA